MADIQITPLVAPDPRDPASQSPAVPTAATSVNPPANSGAPQALPQAVAQSTQPSAPAAQAQSTPVMDVAKMSSADILNSVLSLRTQGLSATVDAMKANADISKNVLAETDTYYKSTLDAYHNLQRIDRIPGGANSGIAKILGLFDSDWNAQDQAITIQTNQMQTEHAQSRAAALMQINNDLPTLIDKQGDIANSMLEGKLKLDDLSLRTRGADQEDMRIKLEAQRNAISMSAENRERTTFAINSLSGDQARAALVLAKQGKGAFANSAGMLEKHINDEDTAEVALHSAQTAAASGDEKAVHDSMAALAERLPTTVLEPLVSQAMAKGQAGIVLGQGTKNQVTIPLPYAQAALIKNKAEEVQLQGIIAAQANEEAQIPARIQTQASVLSSLATVDPGAANELGVLNLQAQRLNPNDYLSVRNFDGILKNTEGRTADIGKRFASTFHSDEAKAGITDFVASGKFTPNGAEAVVADVAGNYALATQTKYAGAFDVLNREVARRLAQQGASGGAAALQPNASVADYMAFLNKAPREKVSQMTQDILADPTIRRRMASAISGAVQPDLVNGVISKLAQGKNAGVWATLHQNMQDVSTRDASGKLQLDPSKLMEYLEQRNVETSGKANYTQLFIDASHNYAIQSDRAASVDPKYTVYDQAMETSAFGSQAHRTMLSDFVTQLAVVGARAHSEMQKRIDADRSGSTIRSAVASGQLSSNANIPLGQEAGIGDIQINPAAVPSATGAKLTAAQVAKMYSGGQ